MDQLTKRIFAELCRIPLIDPHSHINPLAPAAKDLGDLLGYHYYTELAHSAGLPKERIENASGLEQARRIAGRLVHCSNTVQYSWLIELLTDFFGFDHSDLTPDTVEEAWNAAAETTRNPDWPNRVFQLTNLEAIFLTNDFDDPLEGFDTTRFVPSLRTDDLVFKLADGRVRERFEMATGESATSWPMIECGLDRLFERFTKKGAAACAISLPPDFEPRRVSTESAQAALDCVLTNLTDADDARTLSYAVFYALAECCRRYKLPFDLMIGVWRDVYPAGVHQGRDLFDKNTSLYQFRRLFNDFADVTFPISVLTHNQNQELASYAWIFPNVVTSGHWWYSNVPAFIEADLRARLEAVPRSKQIGYYSDAYKLEFVLPKFNMYRRSLAKVLATEFVTARRWSETKAIDLGRTILRDNVERIFPLL